LLCLQMKDIGYMLLLSNEYFAKKRRICRAEESCLLGYYTVLLQL
jgi:hypothetical protein